MSCYVVIFHHRSFAHRILQTIYKLTLSLEQHTEFPMNFKTCYSLPQPRFSLRQTQDHTPASIKWTMGTQVGEAVVNDRLVPSPMIAAKKREHRKTLKWTAP